MKALKFLLLTVMTSSLFMVGTAFGQPDCSIFGPDSICEYDTEIEYFSDSFADFYFWDIIGDAVIVDDFGDFVLVSPTGPGSFTLFLEVCEEDNDQLCSQCEITVEVVEAPYCEIEGPLLVCESDSGIEFCSDALADIYYWEIIGDAQIDGSNGDQCVFVTPTGPGSFTLYLTVCNETSIINEDGCCNTCELTVEVVPTPDCLITGPQTVCAGAAGVEYCAPAGADFYQWWISGDASFVGGEDNTQCVQVDVGATGVFTLTLEICNALIDGDAIGPQQDLFFGCCETCELDVTVESCVFCSYTQGFWGNAGGTACDGQTTSELITAALASAGGSITVGQGDYSITFSTVQCILDSLPAGGTPAVLPEGPWNCGNLIKSGLTRKNKPQINNVLVGQVLALTLNLLVSEDCVEDSGDLAVWILPDEFCTVPYGDPQACPEHYSIPAALVGLTVQELLDAANAALAGDDTYSLSDIYKAVKAVNEGFDECRELVPCPEAEICDNGCDDDFDGLIDGDDPDCQAELLPDLIVTELTVTSYTTVVPYSISYSFTIQNIGAAAVNADTVAI